MDRGFTAVKAELTANPPADIRAVSSERGDRPHPHMGGASGPALRHVLSARRQRPARARPNSTPPTWWRCSRPASKACSSAAKPRPATRPCWTPCCPRWMPCEKRWRREAAWRRCWTTGAAAAEAGMQATIPMQARKGRASYLGERSIGHQDPGATSSWLLLKAAAERVADDRLRHRLAQRAAGGRRLRTGRAGGAGKGGAGGGGRHGGPGEPIGTDAFRVRDAIESVYGDDGVLVLMDLGSAVLSAETALEMLDGRQAGARAPVRCAAGGRDGGGGEPGGGGRRDSRNSGGSRTRRGGEGGGGSGGRGRDAGDAFESAGLARAPRRSTGAAGAEFSGAHHGGEPDAAGRSGGCGESEQRARTGGARGPPAARAGGRAGSAARPSRVWRVFWKARWQECRPRRGSPADRSGSFVRRRRPSNRARWRMPKRSAAD